MFQSSFEHIRLSHAMFLHLHGASAQVTQKKKDYRKMQEYSQTTIYCPQSRNGELRLTRSRLPREVWQS